MLADGGSPTQTGSRTDATELRVEIQGLSLGLRPESADDAEIVGRCYDEITGVMQSTLTRLAAAHPHPLMERLRSWMTGSGQAAGAARGRVSTE